MRVAVAFALGCLAVSVHGRASAAGAPLEPRSLPPSGTGETRFAWRIDGVVTDAREFRRPEPIEYVVARYLAEWRAERRDEPVSDARVGAARVLGQRVGHTFRVAQFTAENDGTTRVLVSSRNLDSPQPSGAADPPIPPGSRVIRRVEMAEAPRTVVQVYAVAVEPPPLAEARFEAAARRAGWDPMPASHRRFATAVHAWRRGADELLVVTTPLDRGTGFLLHLTPRSADGGAR